MSSYILLNPKAAGWVYLPNTDDNDSSILKFHKSLPDYGETPLHSLPELAAELGLAHVLVKDESNRFGLTAFKILGASWAVYRAVCNAVGLAPNVMLSELSSKAAEHAIFIVTSTEGNCGRAVARMTRYLRIPTRVFVPKYMDEGTRNKIRSEGAEIIEVPGSYDDTIPVIRREAEKEGVVMILDVGLDSFEEIPKVITVFDPPRTPPPPLSHASTIRGTSLSSVDLVDH